MSSEQISSESRASFVDRGSDREMRFGFNLDTAKDLVRVDFDSIGVCTESDRLLGDVGEMISSQLDTKGGSGFDRDCSRVGESPGNS
jgi:hypothetical protein